MKYKTWFKVKNIDEDEDKDEYGKSYMKSMTKCKWSKVIMTVWKHTSYITKPWLISCKAFE